MPALPSSLLPHLRRTFSESRPNNMNDQPFFHEAGDDVPEDARRKARRLVADGSGEAVEADASRGYESLERLELREGTLKIGNDAFRGCRRLSRFDSPSSLRWIGDRAFAWCTSLSEVNLPEGLRHIGRLAFEYHCFRQITIPSSVVEIGNGAFAGGDNLSEVTVAGGMVMVGRNAFFECRRLRNISTPSRVIVFEDGEHGNGRAEVVTGGTIALDYCGQEPVRLILASPYLASMKSADVERAKDAINRTFGAGTIRSRFFGLLSAIDPSAGGREKGRGPLDVAAGNADDRIRVREGADRIRSRFLGLLSAHRRAIASVLERALLRESGVGWAEPGVVEIILSFLGGVEG